MKLDEGALLIARTALAEQYESAAWIVFVRLHQPAGSNDLVSHILGVFTPHTMHQYVRGFIENHGEDVRKVIANYDARPDQFVYSVLRSVTDDPMTAVDMVKDQIKRNRLAGDSEWLHNEDDDND